MTIYNNTTLDLIFHALSDKTRRKMLATISHQKSCTAGELANLFETAQPTISKHLKVLDKAGLVMRKIKGRHHYFELEPDALIEADEWINRHLEFWGSSLDRLDEFLNESNKK